MIIPYCRNAVGCTLSATIGGFLIVLLVSTASISAGEFRLGTAAVKITPPDGTPMAGYYSPRGSTGVLDDLYVKAAVLYDGQTEAALVVCDVISLPRSVVVQAKQIIEAKSRIPAGNIMISATHTHTGPAIVSGSSCDELAIGDSELSQDYTRRLPTWIAQTVEQAHTRLTPAHVAYASVSEPHISLIRRFWMKDGTVGWNPGKLNPNIVRPIGDIDRQVNVVYAETPSKMSPTAGGQMARDGQHHVKTTGSRPLLTYVNFALHLDTTGGTRISADFPATLARRLADYKGRDMLTMFANGACGNINHLDVRSAVGQTSPEEAERLGTILAADVLRAYMHLKSVEDLTLRVRCKKVELPLAEIDDEDVQEAQRIAARRGKDAAFLEIVKAYKVLDVAARNGKPIEIDVQVFALGQDIAWVALPGEVFVELGLSIKAASPFRQTNIVELANGVGYYIPNRSAYAEGQYEVISSRYAAGAGEMLVTEAIRQLDKLYRDALHGMAEQPLAK